MSSNEASDVLGDILSTFQNLLRDASDFGPSDTIHLTRSLATAAKRLQQIAPSLHPAEGKVDDFILQLARCFVGAGETTKVAQGLQKILEAMGVNCKELVNKYVDEELASIVHQLALSGKDLKKVSTLLESSRLIQMLFMSGDLVPSLLQQLSTLFSRLLQCSPIVLTRKDCDKLHYTVKLCLQLFQMFPKLRHQGWSHLQALLADMPSSDKSTDSLAQIINGIMAVLISKSYGRETTLLAGTAVSMVITAAACPEESVHCFFSVFSTINNSILLQQLKQLHLDSAASENKTLAKHRNCTAEIALLRSILMGSSPSLLCCDIQCTKANTLSTTSSPVPQQVFLLSLFPHVCDACDAGTESQYLSFQLLSLWAQKLSSCLPHLSRQGMHNCVMGKESSVIREMLKRIWVTLDSPVEGVAEFAAEALKTLLEMWHAEVKSERSDYVQLAEELMKKVIQVPWYARSRYKPFSLLIPYVHVDKLLEENKGLKQELLDCMGASFLTALASDVYTACLQSLRNSHSETDQQAQKWKSVWLSTMMSGLTHSDSLIRNKVCTYWLVSTLKILPNTGPLLQDHLQEYLLAMGVGNHSHHLFAWVAVCRIRRTLAELDLKMLPEMLLAEAVYSDDEDICAEAMAVLSTTQKKAEPLGSVEIDLFQAALPFCLKVDSAPFRQKLLTSLRKVFVRVRDSCLTAIKRKTKDPFVDGSLQFVDWLYKLVMVNMVPGACFQRRRACLDIVQALLETIIFLEEDSSKKGKAQCPTDVLMKYAHTKGLWDFFSTDSRTILLHCVTDGADEIQESAIHILSKYFSWTTGSPSATNTVTVAHSDLASHLLHHAMELCCSPRAYENHSGALLIRLVYEKFVREQGVWLAGPDEGSSGLSKQRQDTGHATGPCAAFFKNLLLSSIESSLKASEVDVLQASKNNPTHGMLQALCECLRAEQAAPQKAMKQKDWQSVLARTVTLSTSTVTLMLHMLAGHQAEGSCPSFAEMGMALEQLVTGDGSAEQEMASSLSPEFQLLLSWCWLNLKESCTCLGTAVNLATQGNKDSVVSLPLDVVKGVGDTFLKVLTHCRHRGAIEGCRNGFLQFSTSLMSCNDASFSVIPANILSKVLDSLERDEMTSSVTRRSAGLPIIVQTIIQAEKRCKSNKLVQNTVSSLYSIASRTSPSQHVDQTQDQAPVHALNILKAIFSDASLAGDLLGHLGKVTELVICCFESSSWAIRNAATQLVSTLVTRMFGQRNKASLNCNMMTLQEWSAHFPELLDFVSDKLERSLGSGDDITTIQPSLFLVLTLLASLGHAAQAEQCHRSTLHLRTTVLKAVSSSVYFLRELSATAVVALTPLDSTETCVKELLGQLTVGSSVYKCSNSIHGTLICLDKLMASRTLSPSVADEVVCHALNNPHLLSPADLCPLVCAKCVDVMGKACTLLPSDCSLRARLLQCLWDITFSIQDCGLQVGKTVFLKSITQVIFYLLTSCGFSTSLSLPNFVRHCLLASDAELRCAMLDCMLINQQVLQGPHSSTLLKLLWQAVRVECSASCLTTVSKLLVSYQLQLQHLPEHFDIDLCPDDMDILRSRFSKLANVQAALFPMEAIVLCCQVKDSPEAVVSERLSVSLCEWCHRLVTFSQPGQNEDFRTAAAQGLSLAGGMALVLCARQPGTAMETALVSVVESCLMLLEETDSGIRKVVTRFVGKLQWHRKNPKINGMNSNLCSKMFLSYLNDEVGHCQAVQKLLFKKLYTPGDLTTCLQRLSHHRAQFLFEPEQNTFFSEHILLQMNVFKAFTALQERCDAGALSELLTELRDAVPIIHSHATERPVYNISGEPVVLSALAGLLMQIQLVQGQPHHCSQQAGDKDLVQSNTEVSKVLAELTKIPNLHPGVSTFLWSVRK